jgi:tetratricopeptide (TPR) repeat protein
MLNTIPQKAAVLIMTLMLASGVVVGNRTALSDARVPVASAVVQMSDRLNAMVAKSNNYIIIANRLGVDVSVVTRIQTQAMDLTNDAKPDRDAAIEFYDAALRLNGAVLDLNDQIKTAIDKLPVSDSNKANEILARDSAYSDWNRTRINYTDAANYNTAAEHLRQVYRAVPTRWLWGGYNYPQIVE